MKVFLIQGFFFEELGGFETPGDAVRFTMFAGAIWGKWESEGAGVLNDMYGPSTLHEIMFGEARLCFVKRYDRRPKDAHNAIRYEFHKIGDDWVGRYNGGLVGEGMARCIITEVPSSFLDPKSSGEIWREQ